MKGKYVAIIIAVFLVGGIFFLSRGNSSSNPPVSNGGGTNTTSQKNVAIIDGKQIIDLRAKGGYSPRRTTAQAGIPTVIRVTTSGTFDCSSLIRIPSMNITKILTSSGVEDIDIGIPGPGLLRGTCGMGMYPFEVNFQS